MKKLLTLAAVLTLVFAMAACTKPLNTTPLPEEPGITTPEDTTAITETLPPETEPPAEETTEPEETTAPKPKETTAPKVTTTAPKTTTAPPKTTTAPPEVTTPPRQTTPPPPPVEIYDTEELDLYTDRGIYRSDEVAVITLTSTYEDVAVFDGACALYYFDGLSWVSAGSINTGETSVLMSAGERTKYEFTCDFENDCPFLPNGEYRFVKAGYWSDSGESFTLAASFEILE